MEKNTEKTDVLRRIVSLLLILTLITGFFVNLPLTVSAADEGLQGGKSNIVNGSFEYPALRADDIKDGKIGNGWANVAYDNKAYDPNLLGWKTTATNNKIEFAWLKNTDVPANMSPHMKPVTIQQVEGVAASDGYQFAEVVANKLSSLFQILPVESGESYKWTIHHRGRTEDNDTLAFIIADKNNSVDYRAETQEKSDCFQQIIAWMKSQGITAPDAGKMTKHTVYTTKLSNLYSFETVLNGSCFSDTKDEIHTEKFIIYLMSTNKSDWREYSDNYSLDETEPDKEVLFVLSPFSTSFKNSSGVITSSGGNLVDNLSFTDKRNNNRLVNAGFDAVLVKGTYTSFYAANAKSPEKGIGWSTTAADYYVEVGNIKNGDAYGLGAKITTVTIPPSIRDGEQFAELNADEESSLYQIVNTDPGKMYKWSLSHRGRDAIDTMALIIGPAQPYAPQKKDNNKNNRDQLMQISDWLYSQTDMPLDLPTDGGCSDKIKIYTPKFNSNGGWTENSNIFSFYKDDTHTEEWSVWVIASKNDKWYDYGELDSTATYSYECVIPEGQENTIFGFVSHSSLKADGTKNNMSYGNLLDNIAFKEYYYAKVEVAMNESHGWATVSGNDGEAFLPDSKNNKTGWALMGGTVTINIKEWDKNHSNYRKFVGAYVNGTFIPCDDSEDCPWKKAEDGSYNLTIENVNAAIKVNVIFAAQKIYYDTRCPNEYQYDPADIDSGPEVPMSIKEGDIKEYTSHEPDLTNLDGWKFMGWKYINPVDNWVYMFNAVHKVKLEQNSENSSTPTFSIYPDKDATDATISGISYDEGITFLGEWKYRQRAIAQTYDEKNSQYSASTEGGTVDIAVSYGKRGEEDENAVDYKENETAVGRELYTYADDTYVTVTAKHKAGYTFNGWYDSSGKLISKNANYVYKVNSGIIETLYAHFDPAGCDLKINCSTYSSESGDTDKYFNIYCFLSDLRAGKSYTLSYVSGGSVSNETFTAGANGKATVILNMKHGDYAMFIYLPERCKYTIEADDKSSAGFGVKGEVTDKLLTRPAGSQETIPVITEHIIFFKASQSALLKEGKHYVGIADGKDEITITKNSSYTLDVETRYNPSIYEGLSASLCFYDLNGDAKNFIDKTRILMIDLSDSASPNYYSYTVSSSTPKIALKDFIKLGTADSKFKFDLPSGSTMVTDKLVFVVDYVDTENAAESGKISLVYDNSDNELSSIINPTKKTVIIGEDKTAISAAAGNSGKAANVGPFAIDVGITESDPAVNTTYREGDFTNSEYMLELSIKDGRLPDGSYAVVGGNKYFLGNGYIKIPSLEAGNHSVNVYSPVPISGDTVTFNVTLSDAVSASPKIPAEKTVTVAFDCVEVAMDADVVDKVLNPGAVPSFDVTLKHKGIDNVKLTVTKKRDGETLISNMGIPLLTENDKVTVTPESEFNSVSGETYIFTFVGYSGGVPVLEDKCCVVGGYVSHKTIIPN